MTAACFLRESGFDVTVLEARSDVGGRVSSRTDICPGRVIEAGAELIGANHPMWLAFAARLGLGLLGRISQDAATIEDPYEPWLSPNAQAWDATSVTDMLTKFGVDPTSSPTPCVTCCWQCHLARS